MSQPPHLTRSKNHLLAGLSGVVVPAHRDDEAVLHQHLHEEIVDDRLQVLGEDGHLVHWLARWYFHGT